MLGIKKHLLQLGNSMVASEKSFELNQNKTIKLLNHKNLKISQYGQFWAYGDKLLLGIKNGAGKSKYFVVGALRTR